MNELREKTTQGLRPIKTPGLERIYLPFQANRWDSTSLPTATCTATLQRNEIPAGVNPPFRKNQVDPGRSFVHVNIMKCQARKAPLEQRHAICATISTAVALFSGFCGCEGGPGGGLGLARVWLWNLECSWLGVDFWVPRSSTACRALRFGI